jgi:hypothetical protein
VGGAADGTPAIIVGMDDHVTCGAEDLPDALEGVPVIRHGGGRPSALGHR